jgi:hypothetical protein
MRHRQDLVFVLLAIAHGAALCVAPVAPIVALGVWWNSNTIAHNFVHRPFFRSATLNVGFAFYQSVLLGIPQTVWRERHLAHHAERTWRVAWSPMLGAEIAMVLSLWTAMVAVDPMFFATVYVPGYLAGLGLCALHGHYEHAGAVTTSHYGRFYNLICFNDGYHGEHHAFPGVHWTELPERTALASRVSRWPAPLRWLELFSLDALERIVLCSPSLQRMVVRAHARAFTRLLPSLGGVGRVGIVGGGLFPRTAIVLRRLLPEARLVVIDADAAHLSRARQFLAANHDAPDSPVEFRAEVFDAARSADEFDLVVAPLAFIGDRQALYATPPAARIVVHDWLWRRRGSTGARVSVWLLKRINLVCR